jgi:hypothetical protein
MPPGSLWLQEESHCDATLGFASSALRPWNVPDKDPGRDVRLCRSARSHYLRQPTLQPCHEYQDFRSKSKSLKNQSVFCAKPRCRTDTLFCSLARANGDGGFGSKSGRMAAASGSFGSRAPSVRFHPLEQRNQPPLPARVAVDVALGDLDRLVTGEQLNVAQAAAGPVRVSRRRRNEGATP